MLDLVSCLEKFYHKLNWLAGRCIELRDGPLRAENGWLDVMRSFEMAVSGFGSDTIILDPDLDPTWSKSTGSGLGSYLVEKYQIRPDPDLKHWFENM